MRELPDKIEPNSILDKLKDKQNFNIHFKNIHAPKYTELKGGGLFKKFEWQPDEYGYFLEEWWEEMEKNKEI